MRDLVRRSSSKILLFCASQISFFASIIFVLKGHFSGRDKISWEACVITSLKKLLKNFSSTRIEPGLTNDFFFAGDIDPEFNVVEITEEAKAELAKIENKIGDFICRLCKEVYDDAFGLAQHR